MTGPARLLLTADAVGGVWIYALELAGALARRQVAVDLAVLGPAPAPEQRDAALRLPGVTLHETGLPLDWTASAPAILSDTSIALAALARACRADLVQVHSLALVGPAPWAMPVLAVAHSCVGTWWAAMRDRPAPDDFRWRMEAVRAGLEAADAIIAPTRAFAEMTRRVYGTQRRIDVVHNARSPAGPAGDPAEGFGILAAGRLWDEAKNIALLDRAAGSLGEIPVFAAGPLTGPNGAGIGLAAITPLGTLDSGAMAGAMASVRIFASPARYEPFGLAVLEAAQAGLPLVLADIPTFRELWDGAALFVAPDDARAWAETLGHLHARPADCSTWGGKAASRAARYSIAAFETAMMRQFRRLVAAPARASAA